MAKLDGGERQANQPHSRSTRLSVVRRFAISLLVVLTLVGVAYALGDGGQTGGTAGAGSQVGLPAPDFVATDLDGKSIRLSDLRGKPVWINFWATWCPPCRAEVPEIEAAYRESRGADVQLLAISSGEAADTVRAYVGKAGITYPVLLDPDRSIFTLYRAPGFPTHYFVGADGVLREIRAGGLDKAGFLSRLAALSGR